MVEHHMLDPAQLRALDLDGIHAVVIGFLNAESLPQARYIVRRLKRSRSSLRVGVVFWTLHEEAFDELKLSATIGCDFVAHTIPQAVAGALSDEVVVRLKRPRKIAARNPRVRSKRNQAA
jgi:hypothetical protein